MIPASLKALLAAGLVAFAAGASAQKTQLTVYTALETDQLKAYETGFTEDQPEHRAQVGARLDRRHHRQAAGREGESAGRRRHGRRRVEPCAARRNGMLDPTRRSISTRSCASYRDKKNPPAWCGHGRLGRDGLLQHRRGAEEGHPEARDLEGPDQAGLQGPDRDAESGVVGHRLLRRHRLAARSGATRTGRAAAGNTWTRCTRTSRSTRTRARSRATWRRGRVRRRHLVRVPRQQQQGQGRADRPRVPEGRPRLGPRGVRRS